MRTAWIAAAAGTACLAVATGAAAHTFDHPAPGFNPQSPPVRSAQSGGKGATWDFLATFPTGNPHTDLDFFTQGNKTFASVGTLAIGPNAGGQTILELANGSKVEPKLVASHPSASCVSNPAGATGLQHDVEATPKGKAILNTDVLAASRRDTQLLIDATDADGRCHDQLGPGGLKQGGLEIVDVTDIENPKEIGLTSHIGESHTVNIDPKRPHIAFSVTSDAIGVDDAGKRLNEEPGGEPLDLDGFEVVDLSSCMNFPAGTSIAAKRTACRPKVFRYRYPSTAISLGHTNKSGIFGCHEVEIYPNDRLSCASGGAMILFDVSGAFDNQGTPNDFTDDKPRGTPLPCAVRAAETAFATSAQVTDCVEGTNDADLTVPGWRALGSPSLTGVKHVGSAFHAGRESTTGAADPAFDSTEDIDFDHEAELTASGRHVIATDERGGGIAPPGASCSPTTDLKQGNGGLHAYRVDRLQKTRPANATAAFTAYARSKGGAKAIYRAPIRTGPQDSLCTAHVFQQIPGQNRIFMAWYSQGTQVVDFEERPDGTFAFKDAGFFIPQNADEWVSHVFRVDRNKNGTFTYYGAAGDFNLGNAGRNSIEVYRVTLPGPPFPQKLATGVGTGFAPFGKFVISPKSVRMSRSGLAKIRVSCRSLFRCKGTLKLRARVRSLGAGTSRASRKVTLGKKSFSIAGFKRNTFVKIRLSKRGRSLARRVSRSRVSATASLRFGTSPRRVVGRRFKLRQPGG